MKLEKKNGAKDVIKQDQELRKIFI